MKCYEVTITGFVITSDDTQPPDEWDWDALLDEFKHRVEADSKVVLMGPANQKIQRKCSLCGTLGHNRQTCPNE
tara:strand:- start:541 stop:762 length:222 start_codon:yes stop_codon:yes gene_type:complete